MSDPAFRREICNRVATEAWKTQHLYDADLQREAQAVADKNNEDLSKKLRQVREDVFSDAKVRLERKYRDLVDRHIAKVDPDWVTKQTKKAIKTLVYATFGDRAREYSQDQINGHTNRLALLFDEQWQQEGAQ